MHAEGVPQGLPRQRKHTASTGFGCGRPSACNQGVGGMHPWDSPRAVMCHAFGVMASPVHDQRTPDITESVRPLGVLWHAVTTTTRAKPPKKELHPLHGFSIFAVVLNSSGRLRPGLGRGIMYP